MFYRVENKRPVFFFEYTEEVLENGVYEITDEEHKRLMVENCTNGKELLCNANGSIFLFEKPNPPSNYVKSYFDYEVNKWLDIATQEDFIQAKNEVEIKMREVYKDIEISKELNISFDDKEIEMAQLRSKLEYIESRIIVKI